MTSHIRPDMYIEAYAICAEPPARSLLAEDW